jgi:hypothetical protein
MTGKMRKLIKFLAGILLLPCCVAITITFLHQLDIMGRGGGLLRDWRFLCLALGFAFWLVLFGVMPRPMRLYVLGHELTHALWALMMGAKVKNLKASAKGGSVTVSKTNFLITLAPYFFPFYCMLTIVIFLIGDLIFDWHKYQPVLCILIGLGWGFHLTFTITTLAATQSDVTQNGWVFSLSVIYWINFLVLGVMLSAISERGNVWAFFKYLWRDHVAVWTWLVRAIGLIAG